MTQPKDQLAAKRAEITQRYEADLAKLERAERGYDVAARLAAEWEASKQGRKARAYVYAGHVSLTFELAKTDIFGDAGDVFDRAQVALRGAYPVEWVGDWDEVKDESVEHLAARATLLTIGTKQHSWSDDGILISLRVEAWVDDSTACKVVQIGEREITQNVSTTKTVPIYRAVCPGDPVDLAGAA